MFLKDLIADAYRIDVRLIVAPDWLIQSETRYAIHAEMPEGAARDQAHDMLRSLLEERFHLVAHRAPGIGKGYALFTGKNGPKLKPARELDRTGCNQWQDVPFESGAVNQVCRAISQIGDSVVNITLSTNGLFGPSRVEISRTVSHDTRAEYYKTTMPNLAAVVAQKLSTGGGYQPGTGSLVSVVDKTGIEGAWDVVLETTYGDLLMPSLTTSLAKQGLRLERRSVPVENLIVDQADKVPAAD